MTTRWREVTPQKGLPLPEPRSQHAAVWDAAMYSCRKVAALYRALHVGIDLMFEAGFTGHRVIEANAFGDLLPNVLDRGRDTYGAEVAVAIGATT